MWVSEIVDERDPRTDAIIVRRFRRVTQIRVRLASRCSPTGADGELRPVRVFRSNSRDATHQVDAL